MDKQKFNRAIELNNKIEEYKNHKAALEMSNIQHGGRIDFLPLFWGTFQVFQL